MTVTPTTIVPKESLIASSDDLWEPNAFFLPNWNSGLVVSSRFQTVVADSRSVAEQRLLLSRKPTRKLDFSLGGYSDADTERVRAALMRLSSARMPMPLWTDGAIPVGKPQIEGDFIFYTGDFSCRRFFPGARVCSLKETRPGLSLEWKFNTVVDVAEDGSWIELFDDLDETYDVPPQVRSHQQTGVLSLLIPQDQFDFSQNVVAEKNDVVVISLHTQHSDPISLESCVLLNELTGKTQELVPDFLEQDHSYTSSGLRTSAWTLVCRIVDSGVFQVAFKVSEEIGQYAVNVTVVSGAHEFDTIAQVAGGVDQPDDGKFQINLDMEMPNQLAIVSIASSRTDVGEFNVALPDTSPGGFFLNGTGGYGNVFFGQQGCVVGFVSPSADFFDVGASMPLDEEPEEDFIIHGVVFNPTETGGYLRQAIFPVIECDLELGIGANALTSAISGARMEVTETPGISALDPSVTPGEIPDWCPVGLNGYPILTLPIDWDGVEMGNYRVGQRDFVGITSVVQTFGSRPGANFRLPFLATSRCDAWKILEFFESRGGRAFPFWFISPGPEMRPISLSPPSGGLSSVLLPGNIENVDWSLHSHVGVYDKQTKQETVHQVTFSNQLFGNQFIVISPSLPDADESRYVLKTAHLCRFDTDAIEQLFITDQTVRCTLPVYEIINEKSVSVELEEFCGPGGTGDIWTANNEFDICNEFRCGTSNPAGCCMCGLFGISVQTFSYVGECVTGDCGPGNTCKFIGTCTLFMEFVGCDNGVIRWEGPQDSFAELDTATVSWNFNIDQWQQSNPPCVSDVDQGDELLCNCQLPDSCIGVDSIITESCTTYRVQRACDRYNGVGGACTYVTTLLISAVGESGSTLCG